MIGTAVSRCGSPSELVKTIHERQLRLFGGPAGIRDEGALEFGADAGRSIDGPYEAAGSQLSLPHMPLARPGTTPSSTATSGGAFIAMTSSSAQRHRFQAGAGASHRYVRGLAAGEIEEAGLARWIRDNWPAP